MCLNADGKDAVEIGKNSEEKGKNKDNMNNIGILELENEWNME